LSAIRFTNPMPAPLLSDGVIFLRPLTLEDASNHLAGEDHAMAKWLSGGRSTPATVEAYIHKSQENWQTGGPLRAFGVFDSATGQLIGSVEANLARLSIPGLVNVSYGVFRSWRRQGIALRALELMSQYLQAFTEIREIVLRISPANRASLRVAEKGGFVFAGAFDEPEGRLLRYVRKIG
jgi:RimJ/RimL family protein N-acetyltransferase